MDERSREAYEKTAAHFGIEPWQVRLRHLREARKAGAHAVPERQIRMLDGRKARGPMPLPIDPPVPEGFAVSRITTQTDRGGNVTGQSVQARPHDPERVGDPVPLGHVEIGRSTLLDGGGEVVGQWVKTAAVAQGRAEVLAQLVREFDGTIPRAAPREPAGEYADQLLAAYPLGDPHVGLRGADGSGLQDGIRLLLAAVRDLVQRGPRARDALIVNLGDFYHSDDPSNKTRKGGFPLDVDGDWFTILRAGRDVFLALIEECLDHHERVHVKCVIGNHDDLSALFLALLVDSHYRDEPRVTVDVSGASFQWFEWGSSLFGFTHGQECKTSKLPSVMATRKPQAWGRARHRHWYLGHVHHTRRVEDGGCVMESFRTLAPRDAYHEGRGYFSGRDLTRIVHHCEFGEVSRETVNPAMLGLG